MKRFEHLIKTIENNKHHLPLQTNFWYPKPFFSRKCLAKVKVERLEGTRCGGSKGLWKTFSRGFVLRMEAHIVWYQGIMLETMIKDQNCNEVVNE